MSGIISGSWQIDCDPAQETKERWRSLPTPAIASLGGPAGYRPTQKTVDAVNVTLALGQPLLVAGEPGCGKTSLADWVAFKLGLGSALRFQTRSTSSSRDLFYAYDAVGRFHASNTGGDQDPRRYISYQALGLAILRALGCHQLSDLVAVGMLQHFSSTPMRSVVLIDEIDKAPRDFPNDVLGEIDRLAFEIPELRGINAQAPKEFLPILIITSNGERTLPDAFLRRCLFHYMEFPTDDLLQDIVLTRIPTIPHDSVLLLDALQVIHVLRDRRVALPKPPGTAELLSFLLTLRAKGFGPDDRLVSNDGWIDDALRTLVKDAKSTLEAQNALRAWRTTLGP
jgi:MoxR-like ATPase